MKAPPSLPLMALAATGCAAIVLAPALGSQPLYSLFSALCHQIPERTWHLGGLPMAVCIRCSAIYLGFLLAVTLRIPPHVRFMRIALAITVAEVMVANVWLDLESFRSSSGLLLGLAAGGFVDQGLRELLNRAGQPQRFRPSPQSAGGDSQ